MDISGFALGMRFDFLKDSVSAEDVRYLFGELKQLLSREDVLGLRLFGGVAKLNERDSEGVYTLVFTNGKIKMMRELYAILNGDARLTALSEHRTPFIQNNVIREFEGLEYFGEVQEDGSLSGGSGKDLVFPPASENPRHGIYGHPGRKLASDAKRVVVAPNAFKGTIPADVAARSLMRSIRQADPDIITIPIPVADGGDGTLCAIENAVLTNRRSMTVTCPYGKKTEAYYLVSDGMTAIIESALASGIALCDSDALDPMNATSYGTGELILRAAHEGIGKIFVCLGGSATNDCGIGMARALGVRFPMANGEYAESASQLKDIVAIDASGMDRLVKNANITVVCDVTNPLTGENGATRVFGPQKGAVGEIADGLEEGMLNVGRLIDAFCGRDVSIDVGAGAAGGMGAMLMGLFGAKYLSGAEAILDITEFDRKLKGASLVITGEGRIDRTTLSGKAVGAVIAHAEKSGVRTAIIAGCRGEGAEEVESHAVATLYTESEEDALLHFDRTADRLTELMFGKE